MSAVNKWIGIGRLGADPIVRYTQEGSAIANISLAIAEKYKDKSGQYQERTEWVKVVFFNRLAEIVGEYLKKGSQIFVCGSIRTRKWKDKSGQDRHTTEIVAKEMKMIGGNSGSQQSGGSYQNSQQQEQPAFNYDLTIVTGKQIFGCPF